MFSVISPCHGMYMISRTSMLLKVTLEINEIGRTCFPDPVKHNVECFRLAEYSGYLEPLRVRQE